MIAFSTKVEIVAANDILAIH